jgi:hypothetical protein
MVRLPRIFPSDSLTYKGYVIPPGVSVASFPPISCPGSPWVDVDGDDLPKSEIQTPVCHCHFFIHMDPTICPDPEVFDPNRWICTTQKEERLSRFLVALGKGTECALV